jgi:hypothetical protein
MSSEQQIQGHDEFRRPKLGRERDVFLARNAVVQVDPAPFEGHEWHTRTRLERLP